MSIYCYYNLDGTCCLEVTSNRRILLIDAVSSLAAIEQLTALKTGGHSNG